MKIGTDTFRIVKNESYKNAYKIIGYIGQGGYGKVYKVEHRVSKQIRAMKSKEIILIENLFLKQSRRKR